MPGLGRPLYFSLDHENWSSGHLVLILIFNSRAFTVKPLIVLGLTIETSDLRPTLCSITRHMLMLAEMVYLKITLYILNNITGSTQEAFVGVGTSEIRQAIRQKLSNSSKLLAAKQRLTAKPQPQKDEETPSASVVVDEGSNDDQSVEN